MPGVGLTHGPPAERKAGGSHHRFSRNNRHSPRDGLNAYTRSPRGPALLPPFATMRCPRMRRHQHRDARTTRFHVRTTPFVRM
jgi:hypothetical protein